MLKIYFAGSIKNIDKFFEREFKIKINKEQFYEKSSF